ncbi:MAG: serine hydrolase domain-containing protein [Myxococcota bacterium]
MKNRRHDLRALSRSFHSTPENTHAGSGLSRSALRLGATLLCVTVLSTLGCAQVGLSTDTPPATRTTEQNALASAHAEAAPRPSLSAAALSTQALSLPQANPESVGLSSAALARLDRVLEGFVDREQIPHFQLQVARRGKLVHEHIYGTMSRESGEPLGRDSIYRLYSMTKVITGVATLIAYEQGRFLLHEPVANYLPELADVRVMEWGTNGRSAIVDAERPITILDLLRHTSGFSYNFIAPSPLGKMYTEAGITPGLKPGARPSALGEPGPNEGIDLEEMVKRLGEIPLIAQPGTAWNYGVSMDVLGRLIEVTTGRPFDAFLEEEIFLPLGMRDTAFFVSEDRLDRFPACYIPTPDQGMALQDDPRLSGYRKRPALPSGGGGLVGTADDYMRFAQMLLNQGRVAERQLLSPRVLRMMMTNQLPQDTFGARPLAALYGRTLANDSLGVGFGLTGSVITDSTYTGLPVSEGSFGWGGAASTYFWVDPEEDIAVIFMTQLLGSSTYPLRPHLMKGIGAALLD